MSFLVINNLPSLKYYLVLQKMEIVASSSLVIFVLESTKKRYKMYVEFRSILVFCANDYHYDSLSADIMEKLMRLCG